MGVTYTILNYLVVTLLKKVKKQVKLVLIFPNCYNISKTLTFQHVVSIKHLCILHSFSVAKSLNFGVHLDISMIYNLVWTRHFNCPMATSGFCLLH